MKIGTPVDYIYVERDGEERVIHGILVGYDPDKGISIIDESDPEINLICLHGPKSLKYDDHAAVYKDVFKHITERIEKGEPLNSATLDKIAESCYGNDGGSYGDMAVCPFG